MNYNGTTWLMVNGQWLMVAFDTSIASVQRCFALRHQDMTRAEPVEASNSQILVRLILGNVHIKNDQLVNDQWLPSTASRSGTNKLRGAETSA